MTTDHPGRRQSDRQPRRGTRLVGSLLIANAIAAAGATVGAMTADEELRVLLRYLAVAFAALVFALAGLYILRSERRSSDVWRSRLGGGRTPGARDWVNGTLGYADFIQELRGELARSRRSKRQCSVLFLHPEQVEGFDTNTVQMFTLDRVVHTFRMTDLFGHAPELPGVLVMLPETDGEGAGIAAERLRRETVGFEMRRGDHTTAPLSVKVTAVTYPEDGTDVDTLLEQLGIVAPKAGHRRRFIAETAHK